MKDLMRSSITACIFLAALCLTGGGQDRKVANEDAVRILSLESIWNEAEVNHDAHALNMLLADTFDLTDDDGSLMNREQWLAHVNNKNDLYEQLANSGVLVHMYENVGVVTGEYERKNKSKGKKRGSKRPFY